jgi:hypothetical protein
MAVVAWAVVAWASRDVAALGLEWWWLRYASGGAARPEQRLKQLMDPKDGVGDSLCSWKTFDFGSHSIVKLHLNPLLSLPWLQQNGLVVSKSVAAPKFS